MESTRQLLLGLRNMCGVIYRFLPPESHTKTITNVSGIAQVLVFLNEEKGGEFPMVLSAVFARHRQIRTFTYSVI